jgi:GNAT superfamily N-acetyltransferase
MIHRVQPSEFDAMLHVINDAAIAYRGVIPADCWKTPYMSAEELKKESIDGVEFHGISEHNVLLAVMGIQRVRDVTLIRHAYVLTSNQRQGLGEQLLRHLLALAETPIVLVGTWTTAWWAIRFYEKHGFRLLPEEEKNRLLHEYWCIRERQVETSVVLRLKESAV